MKRKRRINFAAALLAAILACSSAGTAFAAPESEDVEEFVLEEETAEAAIEEETAEAAIEEETAGAAIEEETTEAAAPEETAGAAIVEETTEAAAPEETTEAAIEEETIAPEKLEAAPPNFIKASIYQSYVGEMKTLAFTSYVNDTNPGNWIFEVPGAPADVDAAFDSDGTLKVTPRENYVEGNSASRRIRIRLTHKSDPTATGEQDIMLYSTYYRPENRVGGDQKFFCSSAFDELIVGEDLPDISSITGETSWYTADAKWQYRDSGPWTDVSSSETVKASGRYRIYLTLKHSLAYNSSYSIAGNSKNDKYDFDYGYDYTLNTGTIDQVRESYSLSWVAGTLVRGAERFGTSELQVYSEEFKPSVKPTGIKLPATKNMSLGETDVLEAALTPSGCTLPVTYTSSATGVAVINKYTGYIEAKGEGTATITATVSAGSQTLKATCKVTVKSPSVEFTGAVSTSAGMVLTWTETPGATYYMLERMNDSYTGYITIAGTVNDTTYTIPADELQSGRMYLFHVVAMKGMNTLCAGSIDKYYIGITKMNAPTCTAAGFRVTWPTVEGAEKYAVFRHIGSGPMNWKYVTTVAAKNGDTQEYRTSSTQGLIPGEWYAYTVRAIGPQDTYGGQPAGRSVRYREPVELTKLVSIPEGVRATFTAVKAGYTYGLYRATVSSAGTMSVYKVVNTVVCATPGMSVWIKDTTAVNGKKYSYYVRCLSKDKAVPLSSYKNTMQITYKKPQ